MRGKDVFPNPSLIFVIPYRATNTTLDAASFPYSDDAHGLGPLNCINGPIDHRLKDLGVFGLYGPFIRVSDPTGT
jgi:hypothetical protein